MNICKVCGEAESGLDKPCRPNANDDDVYQLVSSDWFFTPEMMQKVEPPLKEEGLVPNIPQNLMHWIQSCKDNDASLFECMNGEYSYGIDNFKTSHFESSLLLDPTTQELIARIWLDWEKVAERQLFYAKIKGHELIDTDVTLDEGLTEEDVEWYRNIYFVLQQNGELIIDIKDSGLTGAKHFMTKKEWNRLGVNENNCEFEDVDKHTSSAYFNKKQKRGK